MSSIRINKNWIYQKMLITGATVPLNSMHSINKNSQWARLHSTHCQLKNLALLTTLFCSSRCELAAEYREKYTNTKTMKNTITTVNIFGVYFLTLLKKKKKNQREKSIIKYKPFFLMIPSLWAAALGTEQRGLSKVITSSKVTPNMTRSSDFFRTVPSGVNKCDLRFVCPGDYHNINLSLIPQWLHHSPTQLNWWFRDSTTATFWPLDDKTTNTVESLA